MSGGGIVGGFGASGDDGGTGGVGVFGVGGLGGVVGGVGVVGGTGGLGSVGGACLWIVTAAGEFVIEAPEYRLVQLIAAQHSALLIRGIWENIV